jgi:hypothetical protein
VVPARATVVLMRRMCTRRPGLTGFGTNFGALTSDTVPYLSASTDIVQASLLLTAVPPAVFRVVLGKMHRKAVQGPTPYVPVSDPRRYGLAAAPVLYCLRPGSNRRGPVCPCGTLVSLAGPLAIAACVVSPAWSACMAGLCGRCEWLTG